MGQNTSTRLYSPKFRLDAAIHGQRALQNVFPVTLGPNLTIAKGSLLLPGSGTAANDVQTITAPGSGTYTLSGTNPVTGATFSTTALAFNANDAAVQSALNTALANSGGGSVTVASLAVTFGGSAAGMPVVLMAASAGSVAHTTTGAYAGAYSLYAGSGTPVAWLQYDATTDASGLVAGGEWGQRSPYAQAYFAGEFYAAELPNLDSAAVTAMKARFITGSLGVAGAIISIH